MCYLAIPRVIAWCLALKYGYITVMSRPNICPQPRSRDHLSISLSQGKERPLWTRLSDQWCTIQCLQRVLGWYWDTLEEHLKALFWLGIISGFNASHSRFNLSNNQKYLCLSRVSTFRAFVVIFFWWFSVYLGINCFTQRISKIYGNRKFWKFDVVLN